MPYRSIAALGSSFAAGPGIAPVQDRGAGRSRRNYPHVLAELLGARLTDLTVSGATTATILREPQRRMLRRFPPQLDGLPADADLVTVTAGGNDLGYIGGLTSTALAGSLARHPPLAPLARRLRARSVPALTPADVVRARQGLVDVVAAVRARAPRAHVVLVDYLSVLGDDSVPSRALPLDAAAIDAFRAVADALAGAFADASAASGARLLRASALSASHALGSSEPWVTGWLGLRGASFHPTADGMRAVAVAVHEALTGSDSVTPSG